MWWINRVSPVCHHPREEGYLGWKDLALTCCKKVSVLIERFSNDCRKTKPKQLLRPITTRTNSAMSQSEFPTSTCNLLKALGKSRLQSAARTSQICIFNYMENGSFARFALAFFFQFLTFHSLSHSFLDVK